ncbi:MAG: hypothetical protein HS132_14710 [Planctomycetia bacterium]|nr:hypothetical protein [Planctomycetia bacterium]
MVTSDSSDLLKTMTEEIRILYNSDRSQVQAEKLIEDYLALKLYETQPDKKMDLLMKLTQQFKTQSTEKETTFPLEAKEFSHLFSLLLGKEIFKADLSAGDGMEKLAKSLQTLFDTLNKIISVIQTSLFGETLKFETIRQVIGNDLDKKEEGTESLQNYLDQIKKAFLVSHKAFQQAANAKVKQILDELDPDRISASVKGGLRFGALRRAELFDIYKDKFLACKGWVDSGRFRDEMLREFEKVCLKLYKTEMRGTK